MSLRTRPLECFHCPAMFLEVKDYQDHVDGVHFPHYKWTKPEGQQPPVGSSAQPTTTPALRGAATMARETTFTDRSNRWSDTQPSLVRPRDHRPSPPAGVKARSLDRSSLYGRMGSMPRAVHHPPVVGHTPRRGSPPPNWLLRTHWGGPRGPPVSAAGQPLLALVSVRQGRYGAGRRPDFIPSCSGSVRPHPGQLVCDLASTGTGTSSSGGIVGYDFPDGRCHTGSRTEGSPFAIRRRGPLCSSRPTY